MLKQQMNWFNKKSTWSSSSWRAKYSTRWLLEYTTVVTTHINASEQTFSCYRWSC